MLDTSSRLISSFTILLLLHLSISFSSAQDTFSIVAVDTVTGEIGSAGASCVGPFFGVGAFIISDVIESIGAIHTQSFWLSANQDNAHEQMLLGLSPNEIIQWLIENDAENNPTLRQYGVVDLTRGGESAAYTGINNFDWKGHRIAPGYAIQGNILLGEVIVDTIEYTFLHTPGPLADRLMAALEAAMIEGADTRCFARNTSSQSAFVKVVRIGDGDVPYLEEIVADSDIGEDPIGLLRVQFDQWKEVLSNTVDPFLSGVTIEPDTLFADGTPQAILIISPRNSADSLLVAGLEIRIENSGGGSFGPVVDLGDGTYSAILTAALEPGTDSIGVTVVSGNDSVLLATRPVVTYLKGTGLPQAGGVPQSMALYQNYPNPFNPSTKFAFRISDFGFVEVKIYDVHGGLVRSLLSQEAPAGDHAVQWDGTNNTGEAVPSGVYFYRLTIANGSTSKPAAGNFSTEGILSSGRQGSGRSRNPRSITRKMILLR